MSVRCSATTKSGNQCRNSSSRNDSVCHVHGAKGIVYILSNPSLSYLKIGRTTCDSAQKRADQLNGTSLPTDFVVEYEHKCENASRLEKAVHEALKPKRINSGREFFDVGVEEAKKVIQECDADPVLDRSRPTEPNEVTYVVFEDVSNIILDISKLKITPSILIKNK